MSYRIPVSKPYLGTKELTYVTEALESGWISSQGSCIPRFEEAFAQYNQMQYGAASSSGTAALTLALRALDIGPGDEVLVPEFTMVASAWAVTYVGGKPVFVDCGDDLNVDPNLIEEKITPRTKAIIPVHIYGRRCDMDHIMEIAHRHGLKVIEDSAEAHGIRPAGDIACYSLFANKIITAGEGGICLTNDEDLAKQMKYLRAMAFDVRHTFLHEELGYNFRMTNLQGAVALAQVEKLDDILEKRKKIETHYSQGLASINGVNLMPDREVLWMYDLLAEQRDDLITFLVKAGIETRVFFKPMSQQPMYYNKDYKNLKAHDFAQRGLYLPTYTSITPEEQDFVIEKVREFYEP
jgi:dTDP-4-amino-4,6-dideoxygalactose transaminase